jgi:hypothetical protein
MKNKKYIISLFVIVIFANGFLFAQGKWYANTSLQMVGSSFQDGSSHNSFYLYNGLRYQTQGLSLSLNIPLVFGSNNTFTQVGSSFIPNNNNDFNNSEDHMGGNGMNSLNVGLGDLYLNSSVQFLKESNSIPAFSLEGYVKFPTATESLGIGTGKFDAQLALGLRKFINHFSLFAQFGYLFLGEIEGAEIINPFTLSLGVGYAFGYGKHSILLAYDSYSTIIKGTASPQQIALGYNYLIRNGLYFTAIVSNGLNSSTSDYTVSGGLNFEL